MTVSDETREELKEFLFRNAVEFPGEEKLEDLVDGVLAILRKEGDDAARRGQ